MGLFGKTPSDYRRGHTDGYAECWAKWLEDCLRQQDKEIKAVNDANASGRERGYSEGYRAGFEAAKNAERTLQASAKLAADTLKEIRTSSWRLKPRERTDLAGKPWEYDGTIYNNYCDAFVIWAARNFPDGIAKAQHSTSNERKEEMKAFYVVAGKGQWEIGRTQEYATEAEAIKHASDLCSGRDVGTRYHVVKVCGYAEPVVHPTNYRSFD